MTTIRINKDAEDAGVNCPQLGAGPPRRVCALSISVKHARGDCL